MSQPAKIDSRFATAEETAHVLGVPVVRARKLMDMVDAGDGSVDTRRRTSSKAKFARKAMSASQARSVKKKPKATYAFRRKTARAKASKTAR